LFLKKFLTDLLIIEVKEKKGKKKKEEEGKSKRERVRKDLAKAKEKFSLSGLTSTICTASLGENEGCAFMCVGLLSCRCSKRRGIVFHFHECSADVCRPLRSLHTYRKHYTRIALLLNSVVLVFVFQRPCENAVRSLLALKHILSATLLPCCD
jgi:hypothetical protein